MAADTLSLQEQAADWLERSRELLQANLLGMLCDHGVLEVAAAFHRASIEYTEWRKGGGHPPKTPVIAAIAKGELT